MFIKKIMTMLGFLFTSHTLGAADHIVPNIQQSQQETPPVHLYKVLSLENWNASQSQSSLKLSSMDDAFIHCALPEQLEGVIKKFWANVAEFVVLKIDTTKLVGTLIYEANNPVGNKYWHIYNGSIPLNAVVEVEIRKHVIIPLT